MDDLTNSVVLSLAGRDKNGLFIVLAVENGFAWYADGRSRTVLVPKKKKLKHLRILGKSSVADISAVTDKQLRKAINAFKASVDLSALEKEE